MRSAASAATKTSKGESKTHLKQYKRLKLRRSGIFIVAGTNTDHQLGRSDMFRQTDQAQEQ